MGLREQQAGTHPAHANRPFWFNKMKLFSFAAAPSAPPEEEAGQEHPAWFDPFFHEGSYPEQCGGHICNRVKMQNFQGSQVIPTDSRVEEKGLQPQRIASKHAPFLPIEDQSATQLSISFRRRSLASGVAHPHRFRQTQLKCKVPKGLRAC